MPKTSPSHRDSDPCRVSQGEGPTILLMILKFPQVISILYTQQISLKDLPWLDPFFQKDLRISVVSVDLPSTPQLS